MRATWSFYVTPVGRDRCRVISRWRGQSRPALALRALYPLTIELPHFIMERRMLLGLRERAERAWASGLAG